LKNRKCRGEHNSLRHFSAWISAEAQTSFALNFEASAAQNARNIIGKCAGAQANRGN